MRAKGKVRLTTELLAAALGIPKGVSVDKVYVEDGRGIVNVIVSSDAPAYTGDPNGGIKALTFAIAEGQDIPSYDMMTSRDKGDLK